jgi:hypothetical protein
MSPVAPQFSKQLRESNSESFRGGLHPLRRLARPALMSICAAGNGMPVKTLPVAVSKVGPTQLGYISFRSTTY